MSDIRERLDDIWELIEKCRAGSFYQDYDKSTALIGKASQALTDIRTELAERDEQEPVGRVIATHEQDQVAKLKVRPALNGGMPLDLDDKLYRHPPAPAAVPEGWRRLANQIIKDLEQAHAEICRLQGLDPERYTWPEWTPQANTIRWAQELLQSAEPASRSESAEELEEQCEDDMRKLLSLYPHNHSGNLCAQDPYLALKIRRDYPAEIQGRVRERLRGEGEGS